MLSNYLKTAVRNLKRYRTYSLINIFGLVLGITCIILIFTFVKYHLGFDTFHTNANKIFRITTELHTEDINYSSGVPSPIGEAFRADYTLAEKVAMVATFSNSLVTFSSPEHNKKFEENIAFAEPEFFEIMDFPLKQGNGQSILVEPNTAIITKRIAKKYFGDANPIGRTIRVDNKLEITINGILEDLPFNTSRQEEIYLPFYNLKDHSPWLVEKDWWLSVNKAMQCFVLLKPNVSQAAVDKALSGISKKYYDERTTNIFQFKLQHISDIYFNTNLDGVIKKQNLWILSIIGLFLIITACVNFINLATAQALTRAKGIGIRKVMGSASQQVYWQVISETAFISLLAMLLAIGIAYFSIPLVNQFFEIQLKVEHYFDFKLFIFLPMLLLVVIFLAGSYPGIVLANCQPALVLKSKLLNRQMGSSSTRKGLVITQFTISQVLIIATIVVSNQMSYTKYADLGFQKDAIVMLPVPDNEKSKINTLGHRLRQRPGIENVTFCSAAPASKTTPTTGIRLNSRSENEKFSISVKWGDNYYLSTFGLQLLEGRNLSNLSLSDTLSEYLINETTVKKLGFSSYQNVIGEKAIINNSKGTIVGIVKDFHNNSFHASIDPLYITKSENNYRNCAVKINLNRGRDSLEEIEKIWKETYPNEVYKYDFLNDRIAEFYKADNMMFKLIQVFTFIAIIIGCLGLYGLILFITAQKTKEIGIRKVNGAKVWEVMNQLNKDFIKWIVIAFVISSPIAWYLMDKWLQNFAYKIHLNWGAFVIAGLLSACIALLTVSWQSWKAATRNPIESIRHE